MISTFESMVRRCPHRTCFTYVNETGEREAYSYRETRMLAAAIACLLRDQGVRKGDAVVVDLPNRPVFVLLMLAAAYGGFSLAVLNHRLTDAEKLSRQLELERRASMRVASRIDEEFASYLVEKAFSLLAADPESRQQPVRSRSTARASLVTTPRSTRALGRASTGREARRRRDAIARQDTVEEVIHFAERSAHMFDRGVPALVMFTSGTTGRPKAVQLTWDNLCRSAEASNALLNRRGEGIWQAVLPLFHIGGFQVVMRSLLNCSPFILYRAFDPSFLLADVARNGATHVSVVDKMLQDMLAVDTDGMLERYVCVLLGGGAVNPVTLERARAAHARVYASYGMTETSSQIAHAQVTQSFDGGLRLLPGYQIHIVDAGEDGFGRLAVKGPGVFKGYLDTRAALTVDGFFLTGDTAAFRGGLLYIKERTSDMFVSGGENVYPAEIRDRLLHASGVADAYVYGVVDTTWGRRPVAFVERDSSQDRSVPPQVFAASVRASLEPRLSRLYRPRHICVLDSFPRTGIGKVDRAALERMYEQRIDVEHVTLYRIGMPFVKPFRTARGTLKYRESLIVEVTDYEGRTGLGECVAFPTDWYLPETLDQDTRVLHDVLAPLVIDEVFLHPGEVHAVLSSHPDAAAFPLARGAIEPALWDLYGKIVGVPLWKLIGGMAPAHPGGSISVPAGAVLGIGSAQETVEAASRCVEAGYQRIKMKVSPGDGLTSVRAVRLAFPRLMITLDANQSFTERDIDELKAFDECGAAWIEEPLDPRGFSNSAPSALFNRLSRLQGAMRTPVCLDESIARPRDLVSALGHADLRCYAVKIGKFGGVQPTLEFIRTARERGLEVWMGGMYETGVSKRLHAAFETLPAVRAPGDIGATTRYFASDVTDPPHTVERGFVTLNRAGNEHGLGCRLNRSTLANVLVERMDIGKR